MIPSGLGETAIRNTPRSATYKSLPIFACIIAIIALGVPYWSMAYGCKAFRPFVGWESKWSIGIYTGRSPFHFLPPANIKNPVLTAEDVTDVPAPFVADPFIVRQDRKTWFMFFEVFNATNSQDDIGLATSNDGLHWKYNQIVLDERFHLSYPYVFKWKGEYFMIKT